MSKQKSVFVTAIIAVMLAVITFASHKLSTPVFIALVGIFAAVGFAASAIAFCKWLQNPPECEEEVIEPPIIERKFANDDYTMTYEQIKREMEGKFEK